MRAVICAPPCGRKQSVHSPVLRFYNFAHFNSIEGPPYLTFSGNQNVLNLFSFKFVKLTFSTNMIFAHRHNVVISTRDRWIKVFSTVSWRIQVIPYNNSTGSGGPGPGVSSVPHKQQLFSEKITKQKKTFADFEGKESFGCRKNRLLLI